MNQSPRAGSKPVAQRAAEDDREGRRRGIDGVADAQANTMGRWGVPYAMGVASGGRLAVFPREGAHARSSFARCVRTAWPAPR